MKLNNKKTGIACMIGVAVLASSCSDWLDPKPLSFYTPEISFTDYNGLKTGTTCGFFILLACSPTISTS